MIQIPGLAVVFWLVELFNIHKIILKRAIPPTDDPDWSLVVFCEVVMLTHREAPCCAKNRGGFQRGGILFLMEGLLSMPDFISKWN